MPEKLPFGDDAGQSILALREMCSPSVDRRTYKEQITRWKQDLVTLSLPSQINLGIKLLGCLNISDAVKNAQDIRDTALEMLSGLNYLRITKQLLSAYIIILGQPETKKADVYGGLAALLEVGRFMAPYVTSPIEQSAITKGWNAIYLSCGPVDDRQYINQQLDALKAKYPPSEQQAVNQPQRDREQPTLSEGQQRMLDFYLGTVGENGSFKLTLWERSQQFRQLCIDCGVELERYWNLRDPDKLQGKFTRLQQLLTEGANIPSLALIKSLFQSRLGVSILDITPQQARVIADEVTAILFEVKSELSSGRVTSVQEVMQRLDLLIKDATGLSSKAQRYTIRSVKSLLIEAGIKWDINTIQEAEKALSDQGIIQSLESFYNQKALAKDRLARFLESEFDQDKIDSRFCLISRTRDDLYLGDRAADCTAFYLDIGFNGWTLPAWLGHPGFNTLVSSAAKTSFFLSLADGQPVLVVDSFETFKGIKDEELAKEEIRAGFEFLCSWAKRIGLKGVYINTIANSSGAQELLEQLPSNNQSAVRQIILLGGLSVLESVYPGGDFSIYLQSSLDFEDQIRKETELTDVELKRRNELVSFVEDWCKTALRASAEFNERHLVEEAIRRADWSVIFKYFIRARYPEVVTHLSADWTIYKPLLESTVTEDKGDIWLMDDRPSSENMMVTQALSSNRLGWNLNEHRRNLELYSYGGNQGEGIITDEEFEPKDDDLGITELDLQAEKLDNDLAVLADLAGLGFTIEDALRQLGGAVSADDNQLLVKSPKIIYLNPRLPKLLL
ncbi:hypothetical protein HYU93_02040 [Candidatus Daviesbacteria bacterium]|nr:hypothetical protein [Candidatus Daviesbacteria bacterium]